MIGDPLSCGGHHTRLMEFELVVRTTGASGGEGTEAWVVNELHMLTGLVPRLLLALSLKVYLTPG